MAVKKHDLGEGSRLTGVNVWVSQGNVNRPGNMLMKRQIGGLGNWLTFADGSRGGAVGHARCGAESDLFARERRHR